MEFTSNPHPNVRSMIATANFGHLDNPVNHSTKPNISNLPDLVSNGTLFPQCES